MSEQSSQTVSLHLKAISDIKHIVSVIHIKKCSILNDKFSLILFHMELEYWNIIQSNL